MKHRKHALRELPKSSNNLLYHDDGIASRFRDITIPQDVYSESYLEDYESHRHSALDLSRWTLILNDNDLERLGTSQRDRVIEKLSLENKSRLITRIDCFCFANSIAKPKLCQAKHCSRNNINHDHFEQYGLRSINLRGSDKITDNGLQHLRFCPALRKLNLENSYKITSVGVINLTNDCKFLKELNLSGCLGVGNNGFKAIGDNLKSLEIIKLSGCRQIQSSSLISIFKTSKLVREIDVSYCGAVSDYEIKFLSENCPKLQFLNLQCCHLVSDSSIAALASKCLDLRVLNLSRNEMPFKITDVSLLALGDHSFQLNKVLLCGCEMITDTGVSWLVKGCNKIRSIDLTNCTKVTNNGIRSIGKACSSLQNINIAKLKQVTDVGIRYLAEGCNALSSLNVAGLYLLSDGVKRDFGFEGLQAIANSKCSQAIVELNLGGCFRVGTNALRSVAAMSNLKKLSLTGCTNLTIEGMKAIANGCKNIQHICLSYCGDCVTDSLVESLSNGLHRLECVKLSGCSRVGGKSLAALSRNESLRNLDFSGCILVDDDALMLLSEGDYRVGLNSIYLNGCKLVTNAGITWLADGPSNACGQSSITTLSLKSTKVSETGLVAVREQFKYSQIKNNSAFFGFWPLPRMPDVRYIYNYEKRNKAVAKLQSLCFLFNAQKSFIRMKRTHILKKGIVLIQARWRGLQGRKHIIQLLNTMKIRWTMSIRLQCFMRIFLAKKILIDLRIKQWDKYAPKAALFIQRYFRGQQGRVLVRLRQIDNLRLRALRDNSCCTIQNIFRTYKAQGLLLTLRKAKEKYEQMRFDSALRIQLFVRASMSRLKVKSVRSIADALNKKRYSSATVIERSYRRYYFCSTLENRINTTRSFRRGVIMFQGMFRISSAKRIIHERRQLVIRKERIEKATIIQSVLRRYSSFIYVQKLVKKQKALSSSKAEKAVLIRRWWRGCLGRQIALKLKNDSIENIREILLIHIWAATTIEAAWRGMIARSRVLSLRSDSELYAKGWKKLFSEENSKYFYYNQYTEECRWRPPPILLENEKKIPICSNCSFYEANVECEACLEFFCGQCWDAVHYGGKRAEHKFRVLFDYYGNRIDYGDGQFPSIWSSEKCSEIT